MIELLAQMKTMDDLLNSIKVSIIQTSSAMILKVLISLLLIFTLVIIRKIVLRFIANRIDHTNQLRWKVNSKYILYFLIMISLFPIWLPSLRNFFTLLSIFGAGVLIVFKEVLLNFVAWIYLILRRPFEIGNRISVLDKNISGDVVDIRMMDFTIMEVNTIQNGGQSTGRVLHIPNSTVIIHSVSNANKGFGLLWNEIKVPITLDSNWEIAVQILEEIAKEEIVSFQSDNRIKESEEKMDIHFNKLEPIVFVEYQTGSILLSLRHLTEPRNRRILVDAIWRQILKRFKENKIQLISYSQIIS